MQISGEMTIGETRFAQPALQKILLGWRRFGYLVYFGLLVFILFVVGELGKYLPGPIAGSPFEPILLMAAVFGVWRGYVWWARTSVTAGWRRLGAPDLSKVTFEAAPDAFVIDTPGYKVSIPWNGVLMVGPDRSYWIFMIRGLAYCVPKRFFASPDAESAFLDQVWAALPPEAQARSRLLKARLAA